MFTDEERKLVPLVAKRGCVDFKALRRALASAKCTQNPILSSRSLEQRVLYFYETYTDPDGDTIMLDVSTK